MCSAMSILTGSDSSPYSNRSYENVESNWKLGKWIVTYHSRKAKFSIEILCEAYPFENIQVDKQYNLALRNSTRFC